MNKVSSDERQFTKYSSNHYIDAEVIRKGLKLIFNIDVINFEEKIYYYKYINEVDAFVNLPGSGGGYGAIPIQQIVDYNELSNEINLTVVKENIYNLMLMVQHQHLFLYIGI